MPSLSCTLVFTCSADGASPSRRAFGRRSDFHRFDDDGQKMAKAAMAVYGIDQLRRPGVGEALKPLRFLPAVQLRQPTGRSGGVPRPFCVALRLTAPRLRRRLRAARRPHPECPGQSELPHVVVQESAARLVRRRHNQRLGCCWRSTARTSSRGRLGALGAVRLEQACSTTGGGGGGGWRSTCVLATVHSSKDAIRRWPRGGARPQDPIRAHERRYGPRDHHCGWRCAECSGSGAVAGGGSSSYCSSGRGAACCSSFWRVSLGRDGYRVALAARGAGAQQLGGSAGAAGRGYLPTWPSSCCGSLSICSTTEEAWTSAEGGR